MVGRATQNRMQLSTWQLAQKIVKVGVKMEYSKALILKPSEILGHISIGGIYRINLQVSQIRTEILSVNESISYAPCN